MTPDDAHRILHSSVELRKAVQVLADAQREALAVLISFAATGRRIRFVVEPLMPDAATLAERLRGQGR